MQRRRASEILDGRTQERLVSERLRVCEHPARAGFAQVAGNRRVEDERIGSLGEEVAGVLGPTKALPVVEPRRRVGDHELFAAQVVPERGERLHEEEVGRAGPPDSKAAKPVGSEANSSVGRWGLPQQKSSELP